MKRLMQTGHNILDIKMCLITHLHGDHFFDIPFFLLDRYFLKPNETVKIFCPKGTEEKVKKLFDLGFPGEWEKIEKESKVEFAEFSGEININIDEGINISSKIVEHGDLKPAYGYIVNINRKKIGFSGDSMLCEKIWEIVQNSDISILDMSLSKDGNNSHMGVSEIEQICSKYRDKTIIATHMQSNTRNIAEELKISNLVIPKDGQVIEF